MCWLASRRARVPRACRRLRCHRHPVQVRPILRHRQQRDLLAVSLPRPVHRLPGLLHHLLFHRAVERRVEHLHRVLPAVARVGPIPLARHLSLETRVRPVQVRPILRHRQRRDLLAVSLPRPVHRLPGLLHHLLFHRAVERRVEHLHRVLPAVARIGPIPLAKHLSPETRVRPVQAPFRRGDRIHLVPSHSPGNRLRQAAVSRAILIPPDKKPVLRHFLPGSKTVATPVVTSLRET